MWLVNYLLCCFQKIHVFHEVGKKNLVQNVDVIYTSCQKQKAFVVRYYIQ